MSDGHAIRVGLIGYGVAGRVFHAPFLAADPAFELAAVVTSQADRLAADHPSSGSSRAGPRTRRRSCSARWRGPCA